MQAPNTGKRVIFHWFTFESFGMYWWIYLRYIKLKNMSISPLFQFCWFVFQGFVQLRTFKFILCSNPLQSEGFRQLAPLKVDNFQRKNWPTTFLSTNFAKIFQLRVVLEKNQEILVTFNSVALFLKVCFSKIIATLVASFKKKTVSFTRQKQEGKLRVSLATYRSSHSPCMCWSSKFRINGDPITGF